MPIVIGRPNSASYSPFLQPPLYIIARMDTPIRVTVLISGNGSNLQTVIDRTVAGQLPVNIVRVLSNRKDAFGLERARRANIPTHYHNLVKYKKQHPATPEGIQAAREEYDAELARLVLADSPDMVACLGFMHVLSPRFLEPLETAKVKIINLHPALPGAFNGAVCSLVAFFSTTSIKLWVPSSRNDMINLQTLAACN